jgi:hypothetical protein
MRARRWRFGVVEGRFILDAGGDGTLSSETLDCEGGEFSGLRKRERVGLGVDL